MPCGKNENCNLRNASKVDSNSGCFNSESGVLTLSYHAADLFSSTNNLGVTFACSMYFD